jgi:hypothetical protein
LHIDIKNINRNEINSNKIPIYKAYQIRQLKQLIPNEEQNNYIDIMKGTQSLIRIEKDDFDFFDLFRKEESNLMIDIVNKMEIKKEEIKKQEAASKYPKGTKLLSEEERINTLNGLINSKKEMTNLLEKLPITTRTLAMQNKKEELIKKIEEVEKAIEMFSKKQVFIKA